MIYGGLFFIVILFYFFEVDVSDIISSVSSRSGRLTAVWLRSTSFLRSFVHLFRSCVPSFLQLCLGGIKSCKITSCMSFFHLLKTFFYRRFFVSRDFITVFFQLLFSGKYQRICSIYFINLFFCFLIAFSVCFCFFFHFLDFLISQSRRSFDTDFLFFSGRFILRRHVQNPVRINIKSNFYLRNSSWSWWYPIKVEPPNCTVLCCHRALSL